MTAKASRGKSRRRPPRDQRKRSLFSLWRILLLALLVIAGWCAWVDYTVRRDFNSLQWALPARIYARPVELYQGAPVNADELVAYLQRLGYQRNNQLTGPGQYRAEGSTVTLYTRGFQFWDGQEPSVNVQVSFSGGQVSSLRPAQGSQDIYLARLEPVEIAQINPETGEDRLPIAYEDVPQALLDAVVAVEDQRFYSHFGVDPIGILRAAWANIRAGGIVQGGSTLTQQLVKNLYLNRERTLRRKIEEAVMAISLDYHFSKEQILAAYINEIYLGQDGARAIHGFALAAQHYFGRPLTELRLDELALLAALPRGASYYNPLRWPERAIQRRNVVLASMASQGLITAEQLETARAAELRVRERPVNIARYPAFMELVANNLARDYDSAVLRSAGLRIFTTLDIHAQSTLDEVIESSVKAVQRASAGSDAQLQAAVVITDANTGEVRALAGSRRPGDTGFNRALKAVRPIGSLIKPVISLAAFESGDFHLASVLSDRPLEIELDNGDFWAPKNYENTFDGDVYLSDALERSLNLATVDLGMKVGPRKVADMLEQLGHNRPVNPYPSMLLGSVDMSPIEVAQIYQTLASNGFHSPLRAVEAVTTANGEPLERYGIETHQAASATSMFQLEYAMQGVFQRGTARTAANRLERSLPLAGKTGTTNDLRDSWFAGYGSDLVGVVWLGYDDNRDSGLTGATGALRVWTEVMAALEIQPRQTPPPASIEWRRVAAQPVVNAAHVDCQQTLSLPFPADRKMDFASSCENDTMFNRLIDRFRDWRQ